jgi:hypothetical protein
LDVTKLTGKEKIEISGNIKIIGYLALDDYYKFVDKPIIKIDGQPLDFEYPVDTNDDVVVDETLISIAITVKAPLSDTTTKVLDIDLYSNPDTIKDNLNGSKTYVNKPNKLGEHINIGNIFYDNVTSSTTVDGSKGFIKA